MELYQENRELVRKRPATWEGHVLSGWRRRVGAWLIDGFFVGRRVPPPVWGCGAA